MAYPQARPPVPQVEAVGALPDPLDEAVTENKGARTATMKARDDHRHEAKGHDRFPQRLAQGPPSTERDEHIRGPQAPPRERHHKSKEKHAPPLHRPKPGTPLEPAVGSQDTPEKRREVHREVLVLLPSRAVRRAVGIVRIPKAEPQGDEDRPGCPLGDERDNNQRREEVEFPLYPEAPERG